nr:hypothetical protein [Butyrivibrio sp.]
VVTVAEDGTLNLVATGNAVITVTAPETDAFETATKLITVQVNQYYEIDADGNKVFYKSADKKVSDGMYTDVDGKYLVKSGIAVTGLASYWASTYYFSENTDSLGIMTTSKLMVIDDNAYYFGEDGKAKKGTFTVDGKSYYANSNFQLQSGLVSRWASLYYYDTETYAMDSDTFKLVEGKTYYFGSNGAAASGNFTVDGDEYYASSDHSLASGFVSRWASKYYYDTTTFKMVKGFTTIDVDGESVLYHFELSSGRASNGWFTEDGNKYYAKDGVVQKGEITIWFVTYSLDEETGALIQ